VQTGIVPGARVFLRRMVQGCRISLYKSRANAPEGSGRILGEAKGKADKDWFKIGHLQYTRPYQIRSTQGVRRARSLGDRDLDDAIISTRVDKRYDADAVMTTKAVRTLPDALLFLGLRQRRPPV